MANMSRQEYIAFQNETIQKSLAIYQQAVSHCPNIVTPEVFPEFLVFMARWNHYSAINAILLYMQQPKATYICSFKKWQELALEQGLGEKHLILPKEQRNKGITLLAPFSFNKTENDKVSKDSRFLTYKSILVFDVSQVNNIMAPAYFEPKLNFTKIDFDIFLSLCRNQFQNDLAFMPSRSGSEHFKFQAAYLQNRSIVYNDLVSDSIKTAAILKEIIRYYIYKTYTDNKNREVVFLSTLYAVFNYFNIADNSISFNFLNAFKEEKPAQLFRIIHYVCSFTQYFIFELYSGHQRVKASYSDDEDINNILKQSGLY